MSNGVCSCVHSHKLPANLVRIVQRSGEQLATPFEILPSNVAIGTWKSRALAREQEPIGPSSGSWKWPW